MVSSVTALRKLLIGEALVERTFIALTASPKLLNPAMSTSARKSSQVRTYSAR